MKVNVINVKSESGESESNCHWMTFFIPNGFEKVLNFVKQSDTELMAK